MEHKNYLIILLLIYSAALASAYDNDTMTGPYKMLVHGDPIHAIQSANTAAWGQWFWLLIAGGPYLALWMNDRDIHKATIWLTVIMAAYGGLFFGDGVGGVGIPASIFYIIFVCWILSVLARLLFPVYTH